jgi:hypothetical protein
MRVQTQDGLINASNETLRNIAIAYAESANRYDNLGLTALAKRNREVFCEISVALGVGKENKQ